MALLPWSCVFLKLVTVKSMVELSKAGNIVLVGFMGSGKSSVGKELEALTGWRLIDLDALIVEQRGKSIPSIFADEGEGAFRDYESTALASLAEISGAIIATGGGIIGRPQNWDLMQRLGPVVYLQASWLCLQARLAGCGERPLADSSAGWDKVKTLLEERLPLYAQADLVVNSEQGSAGDVAKAVLDALQSWSGR